MRRTKILMVSLTATLAMSCGAEPGTDGPESAGGKGDSVEATHQPLLPGEPDLNYYDYWRPASLGSSIADSDACPAGTVMVGGGFSNPEGRRMDGSSFYGLNNFTKWSIDSYSSDFNKPDMESEVLCLANPGASVYWRQTTLTVGAHRQGCQTTFCSTASGELAVSGGFQDDHVALPISSYGKPSGWQVCARNDSDGPTNVIVYAACMYLSEASVKNVASPTVSVAPGTQATAVAQCGSGWRVSGNGFSMNPIPTNAMLESQAWQYTTETHATMKNTYTGTGQVQAIATCLRLF
jgi:hypothetical protein